MLQSLKREMTKEIINHQVLKMTRNFCLSRCLARDRVFRSSITSSMFGTWSWTSTDRPRSSPIKSNLANSLWHKTVTLESLTLDPLFILSNRHNCKISCQLLSTPHALAVLGSVTESFAVPPVVAHPGRPPGTRKDFSTPLCPLQNSKEWKRVKTEIRAFTSLLMGSSLFSSTQTLNRDSVRLFSTSSANASQYKPDGERDDDKDKEKNPDEEEKMPFLARLMLLVWLGFLVYIVLRLLTGDDGGMYKFVSWNEFVHDMLAKGEVEEVIVRPETEMAFIRLHPNAVIRGRKMDSEVFTLKIADADKFEEKLRKVEEELGIRPEQGVAITYQRENAWASLVFMAVVGLALFLIFRNMVKVQMPNPSDMFASERKAKFVRVDLQTQKGHGITFKDVAGMKEAKTEVMEFVDYLKRPEKYKQLGAKIPRGALLLGPPGCGKTLLAKAVATEAKVPFLAMAGSEFVEMLGGLGAARVRDLFKEARQRSPCIIYLDEIDAIGRRRAGENLSEGASEEEHTLNQLLVEMDGIGTADGVIMLASTNRPDVLDKALLRPGRFDRHIQIDLPTLAERIEIFDIYLKQLRLMKEAQHYSERLAQLSPGMSGADICNICNEAALHAARDKKTAVDSDDFDYAVERVLAGVAKKSRVLSPQEKKVVAYHEAGHALVGWLLKYTDALLRVSIVPRVGQTLGFAQYMPADRKLYSKQELFERMCMGMGGRVAESLTFNSVTSGAQDDLSKITKSAYTQIRQLGMNDRIGLVSFEVDDKKFGVKPYSKHLSRLIDEEVKLLVAQAYKETEKILLENKDKLKLIAEALLEKESLSYQDMVDLIGPPPYDKTASTNWTSDPSTTPTS